MRSDLYQYSLIFLGIVATILTGSFFYREVFPEYKIYQEDYVALEKFRSSYTHEAPPAFSYGVKQLVMEREDKGNPVIDRCTSCHVALQFEHFSPTKIAHDINGKIMVDDKGDPILAPNENYVWGHLDKAIEDLTDEKVNAQLKAQGENAKVAARLKEAEAYKALKVAKVGELTYDVTKVLAMHPLIGKETRPFEFHPIEEYGCTSCHNGNGRGLTTEKAHGPVFDGDYEKEFVGEVPQFTEIDPENDPKFARVFNSKPGHVLLFQTTPIYVGALIQAKCVNCHQSSAKALEGVVDMAGLVTERREKQADAVQQGLQSDKMALLSLLMLKKSVNEEGLEKTVRALQKKSTDYALPADELEQAGSQLAFVQNGAAQHKTSQQILANINTELAKLIGKPALVESLEKSLQPSYKEGPAAVQIALDKFLVEHKSDPQASGAIFAKLTALDLEEAVRKHVADIDSSFSQALADQSSISAIASDIDLLTYNYHRGQQLYISQACYACHRIAGFARGGVGPELTRAGKGYPWFVKESIVWPQADLKTSTMPNFRLDHEELEDLVTFLLGQVGETKSVSSTDYKTAVQEWEAGRRLPWEKPITPLQMQDLRYSMTVFATEGCAACHRLQGFESNVGFKAEKDAQGKLPFEKLYSEREWFRSVIPEMIVGSALVDAIDQHAKEIDSRIVDGVREGSILEEIESKYPQSIVSLYTPFRFASRAKNAHYAKLAAAEKDPDKKKQILEELQQWKDRVHRVLMMFVQEYGLGRLIGPRPNWSGVYRTDEWLMEHFRNPASHVPRSIMPVLPFDDTKFYALTHMLDVLGIRNRDALRQVWENRGFNPELAFQTHCSQCHGEFLHGNGPIAEWIYPIPKNLRNADFLRNLTKERAIQSITHGVKGTPMPPWGEVGDDKPTADGKPVLTKNEIQSLVDWLYSSLPGGMVIRGAEDVLKWKYMPEDVIRELREEGSKLEPLKGGSGEPTPREGSERHKQGKKLELSVLPTGEGLIASLKPVIAQTGSSEPKGEAGPVQRYFDVIPNPIPGPEKYAYYIKKEYYTPENLEQGRLFFELNCAVCHGKDADGTGMRAGTMTEAKPRMLTNLDWIRTRDDLRLLRSIKFGVPGTAMTPWGDLTSSLQRMQLVMYIRTLSEDKGYREMLAESIYKAFDHADAAIEHARAAEFPTLAQIQEQYTAAREQRESFYAQAKTGSAPSKESMESFQKELELLGKLKQKQDLDAILINLKSVLKNERDVYQGIGISIIMNGDEDDLSQYIKVVNELDGRFEFKEGKLTYQFDQNKETAMNAKGREIINRLDKKIKALEKENEIVQGRINSVEKSAKLAELNASIITQTKLRNRLVSGLEEGVRLREKEKQLFEHYHSQLKG